MNRSKLEVGRSDESDVANQWLTVYEVAGLLLARPETVKAWVRDGLLRSEDLGRLGRRIPKSAVDQLLIGQYESEGFRSADHGLASGMREAVLTATDIPEQSVYRQAAGWPFRADSAE